MPTNDATQSLWLLQLADNTHKYPFHIESQIRRLINKLQLNRNRNRTRNETITTADWKSQEKRIKVAECSRESSNRCYWNCSSESSTNGFDDVPIAFFCRSKKTEYTYKNININKTRSQHWPISTVRLIAGPVNGIASSHSSSHWPTSQ